MKPEGGQGGGRADGSSPLDRAKHGVRRECRRILAQARKSLMKLRLGQRWQTTDEAFARRLYPSYEAYVAHQRTKLDAFRDASIQRHDRRFYAALSERLAELPLSFHRLGVLCLAARQGTEVRAFIDQGAFAVGIDLNPGPDNRYVVVGDFHGLQFGPGTVGAVYTNSLDHAFDLGRILAEVRRVLAPDGLLIAEVGLGTEGGGEGRGFYEALSWATVESLLATLQGAGFRLEHRRAFDVPWPGEQLVLRRAE